MIFLVELPGKPLLSSSIVLVHSSSELTKLPLSFAGQVTEQKDVIFNNCSYSHSLIDSGNGRE